MSYYYPQCAVQLRILPEDFQLRSDPKTQQTHVINVIAKNVTINVNDYKSSDTFTMEIDYKNFPFDPRTIRACGVVIYIQDMQGLDKRITPGEPTVINPDVSNTVFIGFVDEETIELDETKTNVRFEGRDMTALLIDQKYQVNSPIFPTQRLDVALKSLLGAFAATQEIVIDNRTGGTLPILSSFSPDFGSPLAGGKNVGSKETYWEIIQDMVSRSGLICFMGFKNEGGSVKPALILTTPKNQAIDDDDIKFVYGISVRNLRFKRKLGRLKGFNVQVRSRVGKSVLTAKIPEEATPEWCKSFGITRQPVTTPTLKPDGSLDVSNIRPAQYITFNAPNISSKDQLIKIGQTFFEQYSLQQLEGSFETYEMIGSGQSKKYDLTQIKKGQTICLEIDTDDFSAISRFADESAREQYLIRRDYDPEIAGIFARSMGKFSPRFQIKSYSMKLDQTSGFSITFQFQNIINLENRSLT